MSLTQTQRHQLSAIVGAENVHVSGEYFEKCSHDACDVSFPPLAAISITDAAQLPGLLRWLKKNKIAIVPRGAGTGYTGGAVAESGGIVVSFDRLNRILEIDSAKKTAIVEPGVITQQLADAALAQGLFYPPDPASLKECSLGGNVAECAGGLRCKKYGLTKDYVLGLEGYDIDGDLIRTGSFAPECSYDLTSILIGSEGTLAVISKIALQLIDPPLARKSFFATFSQQVDAAEVVAKIMASGVIPAVLEFIDGDVITRTLEYLGWEQVISAAAALLIEVDGTAAEVERDAAVVATIIAAQRPLQSDMADTEERREYLWTMRRSVSRANRAKAKLYISEDIVVPPSRLPTLVAQLAELGKLHHLHVNSFGHAGDGNLHVNFLADGDSPSDLARIHAACVDLFKMTLALDGTISGEHGIGTTKKDFLPMEVSPETMRLFKGIKRSFDPAGLLNPGKIF